MSSYRNVVIISKDTDVFIILLTLHIDTGSLQHHQLRCWPGYGQASQFDPKEAGVQRGVHGLRAGVACYR